MHKILVYLFFYPLPSFHSRVGCLCYLCYFSHHFCFFVHPPFRDLVVCLVREVVLALLALLVLVVLMAMLAPPALL